MHMKIRVKTYRTYNSLVYKSLLKIKFILTPLLTLNQPVTVLPITSEHSHFRRNIIF